MFILSHIAVIDINIPDIVNAAKITAKSEGNHFRLFLLSIVEECIKPVQQRGTAAHIHDLLKKFQPMDQIIDQ